MTTTDDEEVLRHIEDLAHKGVKLSKTQIWALVKCYDKPQTIRELANQRGLSYQGMYVAVRGLEQMHLLDNTMQIGREGYFRCRFDVTESADFTLKAKYKGQTMSMEELMAYLENAPNITRLPEFLSLAMKYLYWRSQTIEQGKKVDGPTTSEVRSYVMSLVAELEEFTYLVRVIADMKLYEPTIKTHELMGVIERHPDPIVFIDHAAGKFSATWKNKVFSVRGITVAKPKELAEQVLDPDKET